MIVRRVDVQPDTKRRVVLPSQFLDSLPAQARLVAHVESPGRFVIETHEAAVEAAAERIRADLHLTDGPYQAVDDVRAMRSEDSRIADANAQARSAAIDDNTVDEAGRRVLAALGLFEE